MKSIHQPIGTYGYPKGLYRADDRLDYRLTAGFLREFTGDIYNNIPLKTNSLGWRDREFSLHPSPGTTRICVLGDSITFGSGVAEDARFSRVLEYVLNGRSHNPDASIEIINLAVNSYTTYHYLELAKKEVKEYRCNQVVVGFCLNDILPKETSFPRTRIGLSVYAPRSDGTVEAEEKRPLLERVSERSYFISMARKMETTLRSFHL